MHAPSRLPSLHRTPGPLSVPPWHLHLKGGRPRRLSLCSLPHRRNDLIYLCINGNICLQRTIPPLLSLANGDVRGRSKKRETCDPPCDPRPNEPLSQSLIHVMRVTFSLLPGSMCSGTGGDGTTQSKGACVPEVSHSHV